MKKTAFFILMTILVAGIVTVMIIAIQQNQINANPLENIATNPNVPQIYEEDLPTPGEDIGATGTGGIGTSAETGGSTSTTWYDAAGNAVTGAAAASAAAAGATLYDAAGNAVSAAAIAAGGATASGNTGSSSATGILPSQPANLANVSSIGNIIQNIIQVLFYGAQIIFIIILLYGGIKYLTSMGEEAAMTSARKAIFAALIGIVVVFSVWAIAQFVINAISK